MVIVLATAKYSHITMLDYRVIYSQSAWAPGYGVHIKIYTLKELVKELYMVYIFWFSYILKYLFGNFDTDIHTTLYRMVKSDSSHAGSLDSITGAEREREIVVGQCYQIG